MSVDTVNSPRITRVIQANQQAVWDAWTQPDQMKQWSCPEPGGVHDTESDFRVGGSYTISMRVEGNAHTAIGTSKAGARASRTSRRSSHRSWPPL